MPVTTDSSTRSRGLAPGSAPLAGHRTPGCRRRWRCLCRCTWLLLALCLFGFTPRAALAGGGPENVLLVVNQNSWASQTIANHWSQWRSIPLRNVVSLDWRHDPWATKIDPFREEILLPVLQAIQDRGLQDQIDYIIYAGDFPYVIEYDPEAVILNPRAIKAGGSLTGLTYLSSLVVAQNTDFAQLNANSYYRRSLEPEGPAATHGFRHAYGWGPNGELLPAAGGNHYYISTCLSYTSGRGNTIQQALYSLERSSMVDGLRPEGTFYFVTNDDIRARTRSNQFASAVEQLQAMGQSAEIIEGVMPVGKSDIMGAMLGHYHFDWQASRSHILPGAICENLTSYGGIMWHDWHQPPLTDLLTGGAGGSSGTVVEPYATAAKFPHAGIHVHYARGCSLGEAFYQSVAGPYQLIIVGDPLCRPWANIPQVELPEFEPGQTVSGVLTLAPTATCGEQGIAEMRLFVDGVLHTTFAPSETLELDTTELIDGYHELRIVAIEDSPIESQGRLLVPVMVDNESRSIEFSLGANREVGFDERLLVSARAPGASSIAIFHQGRQVAQIGGGGGETVILAKNLGLGPARLQAVAQARGGGELVYSAPLTIEVVEPTLIAARAGPPPGLVAGILIDPQDGPPQVAAATEGRNWLINAGVRNGQQFVLTGYFQVNEAGVAQFQTRFSGQVSIAVDGRAVLEAASEEETFVFAPVGLAPGWHEFSATCTISDLARFTLDFGEEGAAPLADAGFQCQP